MTGGRLPEKIEAGTGKERGPCEALARSLQERKPKGHLPVPLTLFNLGRLSTASGLVILLMLLWGSGFGSGILGSICSTGSGPFPPFSASILISGIAVGLSLLLLPLLILALLQGARLGFFGLAEFICGLGYLPMKMVGGTGSQRRTFHLLGLLYSGMGRFEEALTCFQRSQHNDNIFDRTHCSPWLERPRLPQLLVRLGRNHEAWALAEANVEDSRRDLKDIDCPPLIEKLQCNLIVAALVLAQSGHSDQATPYLEEACTIAGATEQTKALALYARGLLEVHRQAYKEAIDALEQCRDAIFKMRGSKKSPPPTFNSELLSVSQSLLSQCYIQCGQADKVAAVLSIVTKENRSEPPTSVDKINVQLIEADYKISQGSTPEALTILEKTIFALANSDAKYDRLLVNVTQKYKDLLEIAGRQEDANEIGQAIDHLTSMEKSGEHTRTPLVIPGAGARARAESGAGPELEPELESEPGPGAVPKSGPAFTTLLITTLIPPPVRTPARNRVARMPDLSATKQIANRSIIFFFMLLGYTVANAVFNSAHFNVSLWSIMTALSLIMCVRNVFEQVQYRRANFFASQALAKDNAVDVVLRPEGQLLPGIALKNCRVEEGPEHLLGRRLEIGVSNNLVYISQVYASQDHTREFNTRRVVTSQVDTSQVDTSRVVTSRVVTTQVDTSRIDTNQVNTGQDNTSQASDTAGNSNIKARLYQSETSGKVLAIETLGRVLTVKKEHAPIAAKTL